MSLATVNDRLDLVEEMIQYPQLRQDIIALLERTYDSLRLVTKFTYGRGDADDLMELSKTITTTSDIVDILREHATSRKAIPVNPAKEPLELRRKECIAALERRFSLDSPLELAQRIQNRRRWAFRTSSAGRRASK
jgi:DNA mismatch repair ATPase MutS